MTTSLARVFFSHVGHTRAQTRGVSFLSLKIKPTEERARIPAFSKRRLGETSESRKRADAVELEVSELRALLERGSAPKFHKIVGERFGSRRLPNSGRVVLTLSEIQTRDTSLQRLV